MKYCRVDNDKNLKDFDFKISDDSLKKLIKTII